MKPGGRYPTQMYQNFKLGKLWMRSFYLSSQTAIKIQLLRTVVDFQLLTERKSSSPVGTAQQGMQRLATACFFIFFFVTVASHL